MARGRKPISNLLKERIIETYQKTGSVSKTAAFCGVSAPTVRRVIRDARFEVEGVMEEVSRLQNDEDQVEVESVSTGDEVDLNQIFVKLLRRINEALDSGVRPTNWGDLVRALDLVVRTRAEGVGEGLSEEERKEIEEFVKKLEGSSSR